MDQEKDRRDDLGEEADYFDDAQDFGEAMDEEWADEPPKQSAPENPIEKVHQLISEMIEYVGSAKRGLFSQSVLVDRDVMADNLERVWELMPAAMTEAEQVLSERDRILREANEHASNVTRAADNEASQKTIDAENKANRTIQDANAYYSQHKADGEAYLAKRKEEGDAYYRDRQTDAENYASQTVQKAELKARSIIESAERQMNQMIAQENVTRAAEAQAQALRNQAETEYAARLTKAEEDANTLYGAAYTQTSKLLRELSDFQKKQNQELCAYCEDLEKRHKQPMGRKA